MDWKEIKAKALELKDKALVIKDQALVKGAEYLEKSAVWSYDAVKKTPLYLSGGADFEKVRNDKVLVIFAIGREDALSKSVLVQLPLILQKAWLISATTRLIFNEDFPDLVRAFDIHSPGAIIYRNGEVVRRLSEAEIPEFLKEFNTSNETPADTPIVAPENTTTAEDPITTAAQ